MRKRSKESWAGLAGLGVLTVGLLYGSTRLAVGRALGQLLLLGIAVVVTGLALAWTETHKDLLRSSGVNAVAEADALRRVGIQTDWPAPTLIAASLDLRKAESVHAHREPRGEA